MSRSRGMTLVEVLAAIVLLSLLASTIVPWFADALALLRAPRSGTEALFRLSQAADALAADPPRFRLTQIAPGAAAAVAVPLGDETETVTVGRFLAPPEDRLSRGFFSVSAGEFAVLRWMETADPSEETPANQKASPP